MALNYNLSKVYALSDNDPEFVMQIISLFVTEVPQDLKQIELGIKNKNSKDANIRDLENSISQKIGLNVIIKNNKNEKNTNSYNSSFS